MCKPSNQFWCFVYTGCPGPARSPWLNYVNVHEPQSRPRLPVDLLWTCNWILNSHLRELSPRFSAGVLLSNLTYPDGDKLTRQLSECSRYFLSRYWSIRIGNSSGTFSRICKRVGFSEHWNHTIRWEGDQKLYCLRKRQTDAKPWKCF